MVDSGLDRLDHQLKHLPEHAALIALSERKTDVSARLGRAETEAVSYTHLTLPTILRV